MLDTPWLLVGLGNPGAEYARNRHNIGFMVADEIARDYGFPVWKCKFQGQVSEGRIADEKVILLKPETYMNLSGKSAGEVARFYKIPPEQVWVFHDEMDLLPGRLRTKRGGGSGGHNGIKSLDQHLGPSYGRVRLGVGHPGDKDRVTGYVLSDFAAADRDWLDPLLGAVVKNVPLLIGGKDELFMTKVAALMPQPEKPEKKEKKEKTENGI